MKKWGKLILGLAVFFCSTAILAKEESVEGDLMESEQKIIGIIGGTSWESTALYYKLINQSVRERLGNLHSAKILLYSFNYDPIVALEREGRWDEVGNQMAIAAKTLQDAGAKVLILACNTLHKVTPAIENVVEIPFLHIADAAGNTLCKKQIQKIGLLGTQFTMEDGFYALRLQEKYGLQVITPELPDRKRVDQIIYNELCQGKVLSESKKELIRIIEILQKNGAEAILLGCTELGMLIDSEDAMIPVYDTTLLHVNEVVHMSFLHGR
jgi:aspartate racemase